MSFTTLRPQIANLVRTSALVAEVSNSPTIQFNKYPAAHVVPSENEGDYETTTENIRTYAFYVRLFYETKSTTIAEALAGLEEVVDAVLDLFDKEDLKDGQTRLVGVDLPSGYTFLNIWASPSAWGELTDEQLIMTQVIVRVRISRDVS